MLVVSNDAINRQPLVIVVVPGTDARNVSRDYPTNIRLSARESGLPMDTVFLCFQVRALDPARFIDPISGQPVLAGRAPPRRLEEIEEALRHVLVL